MATNSRKCKECNQVFEKQRPLQYLCSISCSIEYGKKERLKQVKKDWKAHVEKVSPTIYSKEYKADLQREINKLSRMIDAKFNYTTCIDCGKNFGSQIDACHFHGRGSNNSLRYHLDNLHSGKSDCNQWSDKHHTGYITGLENRYGKEYLEMVQGLPLQYMKIKLSEVEVVEKLKIVRKLIRDFQTFNFKSGQEARKQLNAIIGIYPTINN